MRKRPASDDGKQSSRHFVFLQGMPSPFFDRIAQGLEIRNYRVTGMILSAGDRFFWRNTDVVNYRGSLMAWPDFIRKFILRNDVTDLVLLGEQRKYHREAIAVAHSIGVKVCVTDFGYLRPDWITLELDGMSENSKFPRAASEIRLLARDLPEANLTVKYHDSFPKMAVGDLIYSFSNVFLGWLYPQYQRSDRRLHPLVYFPLMGIQLLLAGRRNVSATHVIDATVASKKVYFLFPLQLEHDFQIIAYSPFRALDEALEKVISSFSSNAAPESVLLIKVHPWDPGFKNWRRRIAHIATRCGVADRVSYLAGGDLDRLLRSARGVVTVNSTVGLRALQLGCPVKTMGQAIYDVPGMTFCGELDLFWTASHQSDTELVQAFVRAIAATIQIRGTFFQEPGLSAAVEQAVERLSQNSVGQRLASSCDFESASP